MAIHSNETAGAYWTYDVGGPGTWYWDTTHYPSGAYWLQEFTYVTPGVVENPKQYPPVEISSVIIQVTVNNGFAVINENGTDTFAKVEAPTAGSNFKYQGTYTFSTDNQISWTRFDACETYDVNVMFQQEDNDAQYPSA
ncbi:MAG TPA: hypothetical protein VFJ58_12860, partial [Armatimonadota bacterium]|nr:hypothetical protein [Armatimonadota bacterium]